MKDPKSIESIESAASTPDRADPVSRRIRDRIVRARERFHANDNIARFIEPGELPQLIEEVEGKVQAMLESLVIDTKATTTRSAPRGVSHACTSTRSSMAATWPPRR